MPGNQGSSVMLAVKYAVLILPALKAEQDELETRLCSGASDPSQVRWLLNGCRYSSEPGIPGIFSGYCGSINMQVLTLLNAFTTLTRCIQKLCRKAQLQKEECSHQLYTALLDAADPLHKKRNYCSIPSLYRYEPILQILTDTCRVQLDQLPSSPFAIEPLKMLISRYIRAQCCDIFVEDPKDDPWMDWGGRASISDYKLSQNEYASAASSLLGIYMLFAACAEKDISPLQMLELQDAYFPWVCGAAGLLRGYAAETRPDLYSPCFPAGYTTLKEYEERMNYFLEKAVQACTDLPKPSFHLLILSLLTASHLSVPQAELGLHRLATKNILAHRNMQTRILYNLFRLARVKEPL